MAEDEDATHPAGRAPPRLHAAAPTFQRQALTLGAGQLQGQVVVVVVSTQRRRRRRQAGLGRAAGAAQRLLARLLQLQLRRVHNVLDLLHHRY